MSAQATYNKVLIPLVAGAAIALGLLIGSFTSGNGKVSGKTKSDKIRDILKYIEAEYVDTINPGELEDEAVVSLLQQLDPHSS